jgi:acetyl esterase
MLSITIRPDARAFLDFLDTTPLAHLELMKVEDARALSRRMQLAAPPVSHDLSIVRDFVFQSGNGPIALRFYDSYAERPAGPLVIFFHGGGFALGDLESHHQLCIDIAKGLDLPVVAVDYRLAPEHPWPAAPEDAESATRWLADNAKTVLSREVTSLVLAGDSAGGNLAAITARALRDSPAAAPVAAQYLIYPCTAVDRDTLSSKEFAKGLFLTQAAIDWFLDMYNASRGDPRIDLHTGVQEGMPPTLLVTAGLDPLRDEGRNYAAALIQAGVTVIYQEAFGNIHGSFSARVAIPSTARDIDQSLAALKLLISTHAPANAPQLVNLSMEKAK